MIVDPAITLLHRYDELKSELRRVEAELNKECARYGYEKFKVWGYAPQHLRQHLRATKQDLT